MGDEDEKTQELTREEFWQQATPWERNVIETVAREGYEPFGRLLRPGRTLSDLDGPKDGVATKSPFFNTDQIDNPTGFKERFQSNIVISKFLLIGILR